MNARHSTEVCRNDGCVRPAEPGEEYCGSCCLERLLFHREERVGKPAREDSLSAGASGPIAAWERRA